MASIIVPFVLGRSLATSVGVPDDAGKNVVALTMMALGATPLGVLLARQIALQRVPPPVVRDPDGDDTGKPTAESVTVTQTTLASPAASPPKSERHDRKST